MKTKIGKSIIKVQKLPAKVKTQEFSPIVEVSDQYGPTISLTPLTERNPFRFGMRKAMLVVKHYEAIRRFVAEHMDQ